MSSSNSPSNLHTTWLSAIANSTRTFLRHETTPFDPCTGNPACINVGQLPLLNNVRKSLIDSDTPDSAKTKKGVDGKNLQLVFSDEFNQDGRTFYEGDDAYFQAVDLWYGVTQDLEVRNINIMQRHQS